MGVRGRPVLHPAIAAGRPLQAARTRPEEWFSEFDTASKPDTVWTAANVQEVLPDQLSPMGCSINLRILEEHGTEAMERTGVRLEDPDPFSAYFYGKAFLNVTLTAQVSDQIPFADMEPIMEQYYEVPPELMPKARVVLAGQALALRQRGAADALVRHPLSERRA